MKVKVLKCSNPILWYNQHIGEIFDVLWIEGNAYWTRERDGVYNATNWIYASDAEVL